jgi:hypothetical protein
MMWMIALVSKGKRGSAYDFTLYSSSRGVLSPVLELGILLYKFEAVEYV